MKALTIGVIPLVMLVSGAASAVERIFPVSTSQIGYCRGVMAETRPTGSSGHFLTGTSLYVETGPVGGKEWLDFHDENALLGSTYNSPEDAYSSAGCQDCMMGYGPYTKIGTSEHFWQHDEYEYYKDYCPYSWTYGTWVPGEYCEVLVQTHPGCVGM